MKKTTFVSALIAAIALSATSAFACGDNCNNQSSSSFGLIGAESMSEGATSATVMAGNLGTGVGFASQLSTVQVGNMTTATAGVGKSGNTVGAGTEVESVSYGAAKTIGMSGGFGNGAGLASGFAIGQSAGSGAASAAIGAMLGNRR